MSGFPDLTSYGYQIDAELGRNRAGGRITWKGVKLDSQQTVVVKQFCFAQANSSWSGYKAYAQEINILQHLNHPYIPRYLDSIETETGFCLVQEYISASNCSNYRPLSIEEVKQIAIKILDILIYLQQQKHPILHQDIKPDNILLDDSLNAYLIDFGFSRLENQEFAVSSVFKGTPGFIAPEQIRQPTTASDIYSLGVTLTCLLTNKSIEEITAFAVPDNPYQLILTKLLPNLDKSLLQWLKKMTDVKVSQRFSDALSAKVELLKLDLPVESSNNGLVNLFSSSNLSIKPQIVVGTAGIFSLTIVGIWGLKFAFERAELTFLNIAIAILAAIAIGITQLGALTIASSDLQARLQGIILSIVMPMILVATSGLIWGIKEAVAISAAVSLAEILLLSYYWWQIPTAQSGIIVKGSFWFTAIVLGTILGLRLI